MPYTSIPIFPIFFSFAALARTILCSPENSGFFSECNVTKPDETCLSLFAAYVSNYVCFRLILRLGTCLV